MSSKESNNLKVTEEISRTSSNPDFKKMFKELPKMEFAPLAVPLVRRRQTFAAFVYTFLLFITQAIFYSLLFFPILWPLIAIYIGFMVFDKSYLNGSRKLKLFREATIWKWFAEFFPTKIVVEAELDPTKNYIFGYHPHGIISTGAFINFATEATNISKVLPGIDVHLCTLDTNFFIPLYREFHLAMGVISVSKKSILNVLNKGQGKSCMIVVGGAQESLSASPNKLDLVLKKRLGFVNLAIKTGASLVPVFGFGENQIFNTVMPEKGSILHSFQLKMKQALGFTMPLFHGRGLFTYNYGIMPKRVPLTVVGKIFYFFYFVFY